MCTIAEGLFLFKKNCLAEPAHSEGMYSGVYFLAKSTCQMAGAFSLIKATATGEMRINGKSDNKGNKLEFWRVIAG